ncbi:MAG: hypothetical protein MRY78_19675 [Saprospiraceae bacterium]|nr:hypothetical protein [Saprospiraceae bacterium]
MNNSNLKFWLQIVGISFIIIGAFSILPENDTWIHDVLQIVFVAGCISYLIGSKLNHQNT